MKMHGKPPYSAPIFTHRPMCGRFTAECPCGGGIRLIFDDVMKFGCLHFYGPILRIREICTLNSSSCGFREYYWYSVVSFELVQVTHNLLLRETSAGQNWNFSCLRS